RSRRREARRGHRRARSSCPHLILLMAAYRLTEREQDVTRLVLLALGQAVGGHEQDEMRAG
ncbi:MAG TPA: hypothetical protein VFD47_08515, partial [Actinomycetota bacterium]|nr:hypothetical protein [Actinomycetota bacterium]